MALFLPQTPRPAGRPRPYRIIRPLLELTRANVTFLTTLERLPISVDSTNRAGQSTRSQIRYLLLPMIHQLGFPDFEESCAAYMRFIDELTGTRTRN